MNVPNWCGNNVNLFWIVTPLLPIISCHELFIRSQTKLSEIVYLKAFMRLNLSCKIKRQIALGLCMLGLCTKYSLWSCMVALPTATYV